MNREQIGREAYYIASLYHDMEVDLIKARKRYLNKPATGSWEVTKLSGVRELEDQNGMIISRHSNKIRRETDAAINTAYYQQYEKIRKARTDIRLAFAPNEDNIRMLQSLVYQDHRKAEFAALRLANDQARQTIIRAAPDYVSGKASLWTAVDNAQRDFLEKGMNAVVYSNGNHVNVASYSEMSLRSALSRTSASAQGQVMDEWGEHLIIIASLASTCPFCMPWQGKVLIDDVFANGTAAEGNYHLLSEAIGENLFHPQCRHLPGSPYFPGITSEPPTLNNEEVQERYEAEQVQRKLERAVRQDRRLAEGLLDPDEVAERKRRVRELQARVKSHVDSHAYLKRDYAREQI